MINREARERRTRLVEDAEALLMSRGTAALDEVQEMLAEARSLGPPDSGLLCTLGVAAHLQGEDETARGFLERAAILAADDAEREIVAENLASLRPAVDREIEVSVIVPTHGRSEVLRKLADELEKQTFDHDRFELVVVDDGSPEPVSVDTDAYSYDFRLMRQAQAGPGAARNRAIAAARGEFLLILNDDAIPEPDLIEGHMAVHARGEIPMAVLGAFPYSSAARESDFTRILERSGSIFDFPNMNAGEVYDWLYFWTCNISLRREFVEAVGGFDEAFDEPMCEDVELGWRLFRECDVQVHYHPHLVCHHDHRMSVGQFVRRQQMFGRNQYRLFRKYGNPMVMLVGWLGPWDEQLFAKLRHRCEGLRAAAAAATSALEAFDVEGVPLVEGQGPDDDATFEMGHDYCQIVTLFNFLEAVCDAHEGKSFEPTGKELPGRPSSDREGEPEPEQAAVPTLLT